MIILTQGTSSRCLPREHLVAIYIFNSRDDVGAGDTPWAAVCRWPRLPEKRYGGQRTFTTRRWQRHAVGHQRTPVRPLAMHRRSLTPGKSLAPQQSEKHRRCGGRRPPARPQPLAAIVVAVIGRTPQAALAITRDKTTAAAASGVIQHQLATSHASAEVLCICTNLQVASTLVILLTGSVHSPVLPRDHSY